MPRVSMEEPHPPLKAAFDLPHHLRRFLDEHFKVTEDLHVSATLEAKLSEQCADLDGDLTYLGNKLDDAIQRWGSRIEDTRTVLRCERFVLVGDVKIDCQKIRTMLEVEFPLLAKVVRRIEAVQQYAETTLQLESLVGDLEDAASYSPVKNSRSVLSPDLWNVSCSTDFDIKQEKFLTVIKIIRDIDDVLVNIRQPKPHWVHLLRTVDYRVENVLSIVRPQALRDHRAILLSLGWPPPLTSCVQNGKAVIPNPLLVLGKQKDKFSQSFLTICGLQHLQDCREARQQNFSLHQRRQRLDIVVPDDKLPFNYKLWAIDELVFPLVSRIEHHLDWLQLWAEVELKDAEETLIVELEDEKAWEVVAKEIPQFISEGQGELLLLSTRDAYRAPLITDSIIRIAWAMIERCQLLSSMHMKLQFIRSSACVLLNWFFIILCQRCQQKESATLCLEEKFLQQTVTSVNAARYCEHIMLEWSEDANFIELGITENYSRNATKDEIGSDICFFRNEIKNMVKLETDCLVDLMSALLLEFECLSRTYVQSKECWKMDTDGSDLNKNSDGHELNVSLALVDALGTLKERLKILELTLNYKDFVDLWRSVASGLDHFIFNSLVLGSAPLSITGVDQFSIDMKALFYVFRQFCNRSEVFFPCLTNSLKLLTMPWEDAKSLVEDPRAKKTMQDLLHLRGVSHLPINQAVEILNKRKYSNL